MKKTTLATAIAVISMGSVQGALADGHEASDFKSALTGGDVKVDFRYRYENVDQDNALDDAHASTLRSRLTYTTKKWSNFQAQVEVDDVSVIGNENHNDTLNGMTDHSVVADPEDTQVNQAWVAYTGISDTTVKAGRQRILLDNQRFVGGVGWRQNEQTYNGVVFLNQSLPDTTIALVHVSDVYGIRGTKFDTDTNIANISYKGLPFGTLTGYAYLIGDVSDTYGIRLAGNPDMDGWKLHYELEWATQEDDDAALAGQYDADYTHLVLGATVSGVTVKLGQEVQESDNGNSFKTPLGTNHKFGGWADQFLATPGDGLEDSYLSVSGKVAGFKVTAVYHEFEADTGSNDYGDEIDIAIAKKVAKNTTLLLKYADYSAEDGGRVDTQKLWLQAQVKF